LPNENIGSSPSGVAQLVELIPALHYAVNRILDDSTSPNLSKKEGVVLWALHNTKSMDAVGPYLSVAELIATFRDWFVVSERSAGPEVSKAKSRLLDKGYIMIAGGSDHIHLTSNGEAAIGEIRAKVHESLSEVLANLTAADRDLLTKLAVRLLSESRRPPGREGSVDGAARRSTE
jgi:hypothetical protein